MGETVILKFPNEIIFKWKTKSLRHTKRVLDMQRKYGDPIEIIGNGKVAATLRAKYERYNRDKENYKSDVLGTAAQLSGVNKQALKDKFKKISKKLGFHE